ncbi:MAG TPA: PDZ domain-containing protein [Candidatus Acidoferrum sp.]|nr:PDZ domain-containing protein [Candidatus Acidoferrum sp.]
MNKRILFVAVSAAALSLALIALPAHSAKPQDRNDSNIAGLQQKIEKLQAQLQEELENRPHQLVESIEIGPEIESAMTQVQESPDFQRVESLPGVAIDDSDLMVDTDGSSWLGVETHEVTAEKAKDLKLSAERGVVLGKIVPDSPAAKAGLMENDVVTELNGQRVEGTSQFRRMIHEIPAGRTVQLSVWRDGRSQAISVTLGKAEEHRRSMKMATPGTFAFRMPDMPLIPEIPSMEWNGSLLLGGQPRLGIDAEDLSGQLGAFFGAPDGEAILVREVSPGSPAEKAGVKAGDVITSFNGERIHSLGNLREKLSAKRDEKDTTVKLGVLRNKSEISLTVELPAPQTRTRHVVSHRTHI